MKKVTVALTVLVSVALLTSAFAGAYYISMNELYRAENSLPTPSSTPAPSPTLIPTLPPTSPTTTPTQQPTPTPLANTPYIENGWLPVGVFGLTSPTNQTYNTNSLMLNVSGTILAGWQPCADYSLDGGPRIPINLELTPLGTTQKPSFQIRVTGSAALASLDNGSHIVVVY